MLKAIVVAVLLVGTTSHSASAASVSECTPDSMRPYIMSGLREYAAAALYANHIPTFPIGAHVTYRGRFSLNESGVLSTEDGYEIQVVTQAGEPILVFTENSANQRWLAIPDPVVEPRLDDSGKVIGQKCVASMSEGRPRTSRFEDEATGRLVIQDHIAVDDSMLAWVAIESPH